MTPLPTLVPAFGMPAGTEWLVILLVALLIFGHKLPSVMRGLGGSIKEFKKGMDEGPAAKDAAKDPTPSSPDGTVKRGEQTPHEAPKP